MTLPRRLLAILLLALPGLGSGCPTTPGAGTRSGELATQRLKWSAQSIRHYRYEFQRTCECLPEMAPHVLIEVRDGAVISVVDAGTRASLASVPAANKPTIEELFGELGRALREADRVNAEYDPTFGYPTRVNIDWDIDVGDDERVYVARNLTRLD
jgi:hypothetical protein